MKKDSFDTTQLAHLHTSIQTNDKTITTLNNENEGAYKKIDKIIEKALRTYKWLPTYNEKAVYLNVVEAMARHVWFVEQMGDWHRFREAPLDVEGIFDYCRQDTKPTKNVTHQWILPMPLFQDLHSIIHFEVVRDRYKRFINQ